MDSFELSAKSIMSLRNQFCVFFRLLYFYLISHCIARYGNKLANECNISGKHFSFPTFKDIDHIHKEYTCTKLL